ncbi:MAG: DUF4340 domain-containing protein [Treponema sp.]
MKTHFQLRYTYGKKTRQLFFVFCTIVILYALSFIPRTAKSVSFLSRLVLTQELREIYRIQFEIPQQTEPVEMGKMTLVKENTRFFMETVYGRYPVRSDLIDRFFSLLAEERYFTRISKNVRDYPHYGLEDSQAARITCIGRNQTIISDIYFGMTDTQEIAQYVRTGRSTDVFSIANVLASFLTIAPTFWLDMQLYAAQFSGKTIQTLESGGEFIIRNEENTELFQSLEQFLTQFSCIGIYNAPALQTQQTKTLRLILGSTETLILTYTPLETGDFVFCDNRTALAYIVSGYTMRELQKRIKTLTAGYFNRTLSMIP